jgi:hypothetical protein
MITETSIDLGVVELERQRTTARRTRYLEIIREAAAGDVDAGELLDAAIAVGRSGEQAEQDVANLKITAAGSPIFALREGAELRLKKARQAAQEYRLDEKIREAVRAAELEARRLFAPYEKSAAEAEGELARLDAELHRIGFSDASYAAAELDSLLDDDAAAGPTDARHPTAFLMHADAGANFDGIVLAKLVRDARQYQLAGLQKLRPVPFGQQTQADADWLYRLACQIVGDAERDVVWQFIGKNLLRPELERQRPSLHQIQLGRFLPDRDETNEDMEAVLQELLAAAVKKENGKR